MKKNQILPLVLSITGAILFNYLFWNQLVGVNLLIFTLFIIVSFRFLSGFTWNRLLIINSLSLLILSLAISLHSSSFAFVMYVVTFVLFVGTSQEPALKTNIFAALAAFSSLIKLPVVMVSKFPAFQGQKSKLKFLLRLIKLAIIPLLILFLFYIIFINANPIFNVFSNKLINSIINFVTPAFKNLSFARIVFILFGFSLVAWVLYKSNINKVLARESKNEENITRIRKKKKQVIWNTEILNSKAKFLLSLGLKSEYISALILLILVNILLLAVNIIDIKWVWFGFEYSEEFDLKQFVHEGTYLLIISILLSMIIMLYYFRRNLNFYPKKKLLQKLSYLWIAQNFILAVSVVIRNLHYITYWGLAYKRIGVFIFLTTVVFGLVTLYIKIKQKKSFYYLLRTNSLAIFLILVSSSLLNWDSIIAKHNLKHGMKDHMETSFLLSMSDKVLPLIDKYDYILDQSTEFNTYRYYSDTYKNHYNFRVKSFMVKYEKHSWFSWNLADWKAYKYYKKDN
ncbi:MAG: DUF4173 domain-containing protein [Bacteroidota bacterium]